MVILLINLIKCIVVVETDALLSKNFVIVWDYKPIQVGMSISGCFKDFSLENVPQQYFKQLQEHFPLPPLVLTLVFSEF